MINFFQFPTAVGEMVIENTLRAFQGYNLAAEQSEKVTKMMLEASSAAREEGKKMTQKWAEMARDSQRQMSSMMTGAVKLGAENYKSANQQTVEELTKQIDRLNKQVEAFGPKTARA